jgi:alkylation response protein AidB-like acyl-CoA dehydrogenase
MILLELTDEQAMLREATQRFLERESPSSVVRALYETRDGFDRAWWRRAADLGWTSFFVPESHGGGSLSGRPVADATMVAEEIGRAVAPGPFLPVNVVAAALSWAGASAATGAVLRDLATGDAIATWALAEPGDRWDVHDLTTTARLVGDEVRLTGDKSYVEAAAAADHFLVTAVGETGLTQVLVPARAPGVTVTSGRSVDMTRRFGRVRLDDVRLPRDLALAGPAGAAHLVQRQLHLAMALQCAEMIGVAERTLETTLEYGRDRIAFGRPIVSFQALKHRIADMAVWLEGMKAVTAALVDAVDLDADDAHSLACAAKAYVGQHCVDIVDDCVQITGGLGVTWEHDIHLFNRRAVVDRAIFGTPERHRSHVASALAAADA